MVKAQQDSARAATGADIGDCADRLDARALPDQTDARLRAAMDELPEGIVLLDPEGRYIHWNKSYADIYRRSADLFQVGVRMVDTLRVGVARGDYPEAIGREEAWLDDRMKRLAVAGERHEQHLSDGRCIMIEERRLADGCTIGIRVDVTDMKAREASFRLLFENNPLPMFVYDRQTLRLLAANETARANYGYSDEQFAKMSYADIAVDHDQCAASVDGAPTENRLERHIRADGSLIDVATFSRTFAYEGRPAIILSAIDMTERNRNEARISFLARHDSMTGLPNRTFFREQLEIACDDGAQGGHGFDLMLVDLDSFKEINDTKGHAAGDAILQCVASRLLDLCPPAGLAARLGGDEFAVINPRGPDAIETAALGRRIIASLGETFAFDGQDLRIGASIGVACSPHDGLAPDDLLRRADLALYESKARGGGKLTFFIDEYDEALQERRLLERDLRCAMANNELEIHYQPIINLETGRTAVMEALLRWRHPQRGHVPPSVFIPFAEDIGLICDIGAYVLQQACKDAAAWPSDVKLAVNMSPVQFRSGNVLGLVLSALAASDLPPERLEVEITEALLMDRSDHTLTALHALRRLGVGISMDDFGTGYSSLSYLRTFPFTKIKIDRCFVQSISANPESQAIVAAILGLGASLGMEVVAEGIETAEELNYLRKAGCPQGQGFLLARPAPAAALTLDAPIMAENRAAAA